MILVFKTTLPNQTAGCVRAIEVYEDDAGTLGFMGFVTVGRSQKREPLIVTQADLDWATAQFEEFKAWIAADVRKTLAGPDTEA